LLLLHQDTAVLVKEALKAMKQKLTEELKHDELVIAK
jgi:hypothetical protein